MLGHSDISPCQKRASLLKNTTHEKVLTSLQMLMDVCEGFLKNPEDTREGLLKIPFSPFLCGLNAGLLDAVETRNEARAKDLIQVLQGAESFASLPPHLTYALPPFPQGLEEEFLKACTLELPDDTWVKAPDSSLIPLNQRLIDRALAVLSQIDPEMADEHRILIQHYVLLDANNLVAGSSFEFLGLIFIGAIEDPHGVLEMLYYLVHEQTHQYLYHLTAQDPFVLNDNTDRHSAPLRADARPMEGIFHATVVLARCLRVFAKLKGKEALTGIPESQLQTYCQEYGSSFTKGARTVLAYGQLTPLGDAIIRSSLDMVSPCFPEYLP
jgi:hypothetical protein